MYSYSEGDLLKFDYEHDGLIEKGHVFILANCYDLDSIFQIICISGYHAGTIEGYIKEDKKNSSVISKEHLVKELNRNFINILWETFEDKLTVQISLPPA